ncbi:hypothetical protein OE699_15200 [Sedimentimonas flavescens]|uniref:50S ribosomal protein L35 n=2 Tax=Rhodobacter group TaxID=3374108 RepID=A0ABT3A2G8_9RHOB|nr:MULTISPECIES: hypothetical protein [Paracoccaceae]MCE5973570.1 hypothetical protein [Sinirhodobacter sp. WL0062]MCT2540570.1 hypothetical protein [Sedimentimonas flavescens]MCV2880190.1 hypothetical protein [Sedimentimonas flavescens]WBL33461.1 hypothetical protein O5O51_01755 [Sinirhodobacter sp. HNIBRBA609]
MIDMDTLLALGVVIFLLSIPSGVSAFANSRPPHAAILAVVVGGGLLIYAAMMKPGGYTMGEVPDVVLSVIGRILL